MICEKCRKEFNEGKTECSEPWDRGDGIMYGSCSYTIDYTCPHCNHKNQSPYRLIYGM